jgi:predicted Zn-dependent protease
MKKLFIAFAFLLLILNGFSQVRYDNGGITDKGSFSEFTIQGNSWDHRIITYFFQNTTPDISQNAAQESVRTAFRTWQTQAHIYFIEVCNAGSADIVILWANGNHGDGSTFDGPFGILAHAFYPPPNSGSLAGDVHFDEGEDWSDAFLTAGPQPVDLQTVALHEIGHSLGLAHSNITNAVMYPYYLSSHRNLDQDDINGIRTIYGAPISFINGPDRFCSFASFSIAETLPTGYTVSWSTNNSLVSVSSNGFVVNNGFVGFFTLTATVSNGCGSMVFTKTVQTVNDPPIIRGTYTNAFDGSINPLGIYPYTTNTACTGYNISTNMDIEPGTTAYWTKVSSSNVVNWQQTGNDIQFYLWGVNQFAIFQLTITNDCGSVTKQFKWQSSNCGGGGGCDAFTLSPNPSNGKLIIGVPNFPPPCFTSKSNLQIHKNLQIAKVNVYNLAGTILMQFEASNKKQYSIDIARLVDGSYYVEIISPEGYKEKQLVILHK